MMGRKEAKAKYYKENKDKINAYGKQWRANNPEYRKNYSLKNKEKIKLQSKAYWENNKEKGREAWLRNEYGITVEDFNKLLEAQENKCAICVVPFESSKKTYVDHCHTSGKVRGILCPRCNILMSFLDEDAFDNKLTKAVKYKHGN